MTKHHDIVRHPITRPPHSETKQGVEGRSQTEPEDPYAFTSKQQEG